MPRTKEPIPVQAQIDCMVKRIVRKFRPEKIILFGSHARGEAGADSDVDLLIVMPVEDASAASDWKFALGIERDHRSPGHNRYDTRRFRLAQK